MAKRKEKRSPVKRILATLSVLVLLGFTTFLAAYAPAREYLLGSFARTPSSTPPNGTVISKANLPITGTFVQPDLFYTSEQEYRMYFQELSDMGIDTIILMLNGQLSENCQTKQYKEDIDSRLYAGNPQFIPLAVKLAKEYGMKVYFSIAQYKLTYNPQCFYFNSGSVGKENTDKGRLIAFALRQVTSIKQMVSTTGVSWSDPTIAGFYLFPEVDAKEFINKNSASLLFFAELSTLVKQKEPTKKIMTSNYQSEAVNYEDSYTAYSNLFKYTKIDIVAPQDSMGTGLTKTYKASAEHFRALRDAAKRFPGKQAWSNVETFASINVLPNTGGYAPSTYNLVQQQIQSAKPYTSKMITWIYSHAMYANPASDNMAAKNQYAMQYNPEYAVRRTALRRDYLSDFGGVDWKIASINVNANSLLVTGQFGPSGSFRKLVVMYVTLNGQVQRYTHSITAQGGLQVVTISKSVLSGIDWSKPYTAYVLIDSRVTIWPTGTTTPTIITPSEPTVRVSRTPTPTVTGRWYPF